ncbi:type IV pili methyl-accepting chemotaxis transducer N-terminal domain-containing protein, partial [Alienimonas sp. DA493]|uniref:type IV pili methyl-accepting chemotaxis transducer N-terminal domain-containing protein n=1 Tax=Alienimonas sp. DA493 TaxID=3373605 RepID=UPI003754CD34
MIDPADPPAVAEPASSGPTARRAPEPTASAAPEPAAPEADPRRMLNRRFAAAMTAAALLAVANQTLVQPALLDLTTDAPVINVAGRQRMLSQRLAKAALAGEDAASPDERAARREELRDTLALWTRSHRGLRNGDAALELPGKNPPPVRAAFDELEPHFDAARRAAADLIAGRGDPAERRRALLAAEREYLPRMDRIVSLYEDEAQARVAALRRTGWGLTFLVLIALAAVGLFVLRPAG